MFYNKHINNDSFLTVCIHQTYQVCHVNLFQIVFNSNTNTECHVTKIFTKPAPWHLKDH